jgi:molybdopterin synthase sulfur carrier subunit
MNITIKYFGLIAEITQCNEEILEFSKSSIADLLLELFQKYPLLNGKDFQVALNQEIVSKETIISNGEIALLPPFAGG